MEQELQQPQHGDSRARRHAKDLLASRRDFALRLAKYYLDLNLPESAGRILSDLRKTSDKEPELRLLECECAVRTGNHDAVLGLGGQLAAERDDAPWLFSQLAHAAFVLGRRTEAAEAAWRALDYLPGNRDLAAILATERGGEDRPAVPALVRDCAQVGLSPHVTIDAVLPVLLDARPAACVFDDGVAFGKGSHFSHADRRDALVALTRHLYRTYGLRTAFCRYAAIGEATMRPMGKIYLARSQALYEMVERVERLHWETFRLGTGGPLGSERALAEEGRLLGYPPCCTAWAMERRGAGRAFEREALAALVLEECAARACEDAGIAPPSTAYFAFEFYPCDPRCPEAEAIGQRLLSTYRDVDERLADLFSKELITLNKSRVWNTSDLKPYPEFVHAFNGNYFTASLPDWQQAWLRRAEAG